MTQSSGSTQSGDDRLDLAYRILSGDDSDERACDAILDSACTELPRNYLLNVANGTASKLAEQIAGPNLVIPWLLAAVGAPAVLVGFLMPIKQAGSLLPQLFVAGAIRRVARRKWVWSGAALVQAASLCLVAASALLLPPAAAGGVVLALMLLFSVASGAASVAFQDVTAKTVPKGQRGRMLGNRATLGGLLAVAGGGGLQLALGDRADLLLFAGLLLAGALLWVLAAGAFAAITEQRGATQGGRSLWGELRSGLHLLGDQPGFRRYAAARIVLMVVEVSMPFYVLHAQDLFGSALPALGLFVLTVGAANVVSSRLLGRLADRSSRGVMGFAGIMAAVTALAALGIEGLDGAWRSPYLYAVVFVLLGFAEQGVRLGRKTYLVDAAPADERPLYVALANTLVGGFAILAGLLGGVADIFSPSWLVALLGLLGVAGLVAVCAMPPADRMVREH